MDRFFDGTFFTFGIEVLSFAERDQEDRIGRVCTCVVSAAVLPGHRVPLLQLQAVHRLRPARVLHLLHTLHDSVRYSAHLALV